MHKIKNVIIFLINLPIFVLSKLMIRNPRIWIFGSWFGKKYSDNPKYLFEYVSNNCKDITAIWITNNNETYKLIKKKGYKVAKTYSLSGYYYTLLAKYAFISVHHTDINLYASLGIRLINLWHGSGASKKIMMDDDITGNLSQKTLYKILKKIFLPNYYSCIATSETTHKFFSSAFRTLTKRVDIIGQPRCDAFYQDVPLTEFNKKLIDIKNQGLKIGIYMPTHRKEGKIDFSKFLIDELENMNRVMKENNILMLIKLHFYHQNEINNLKKEFSNIIFVNDEDIEQDVYTMLPLTDFLITDYSSVYVDYLHSGKPVLFFPFDRDDYSKTDRVGYMDYDDITPGPISYNWNDLYKDIVKILFEKDEFVDERQRINDLFSLYQDGRNCERVVEWIKSLR